MDEAEGLQEIVIAEEMLLQGDAQSLSIVEALARGVQTGGGEVDTSLLRTPQTSRRVLRTEFRSR